MTRHSVPRPGIVSRVQVTDVYDGDTVDVTLTRRVRVRLLDCWAPEIRTHDDEEKRQGLAARNFLKEFAEGQDAILEIPTEEATGLDDVFTFGRVLGRLYVRGKNVSAVMVQEGHATATKRTESSPSD